MQYNPDGYVSYWNQANSDWFQTLIYMGPAGCPDFSIEVWNTWWASWGVSRLDYRADYANIPCQIAYLSPGAVWYIREDLVSTSSSHISDVYFSIQGPNGVVYNHLFTDPGLQFWWWELSNLC